MYSHKPILTPGPKTFVTVQYNLECGRSETKMCNIVSYIKGEESPIISHHALHGKFQVLEVGIRQVRDLHPFPLHFKRESL